MVEFLNLFSIETFIFVLPAVIIALSFHEFAHAWMADKLGDPTPRLQGRLTVDIRKHIDIWGLLMLLVFHFGWGKPVETNPRYLKDPKKGVALISLAGPLMNIIIALISIVILAKMQNIASDKVSMLLSAIFSINAGLAVFNLIPIPPLDGSKIITIFLPPKTYYRYLEFQAQYEMYLIIGLFLLISTPIFSVPLTFAVNLIGSLGILIANALPF